MKKKPKKINVVIDDAGSGNFVGGMVIEGYSEELDLEKAVVIEPKDYNENIKTMQNKVWECVEKIIDFYSENNQIDTIFLCQSCLFDMSTDNLVEREYVVVRGKVVGKLQDIIEDEFVEHLKNLGMPDYIKFFNKVIARDKNAGYRMLNNFCINFVKVDLNNRLEICKNQNKLYDDVSKANIKVEEVKNRFSSKLKLCCNCGRHIQDELMLKYSTANRNNVFYTHLECLKK